MFDLSIGEILLIALVALIVVGPRELPAILRTLGRTVGKLRNMSWELREQSGIDDMLKKEGLDKDIDAIRSLSRGRMVDAIMTETARPKRTPATAAPPAELTDDPYALETRVPADMATPEPEASQSTVAAAATARAETTTPTLGEGKETALPEALALARFASRAAAAANEEVPVQPQAVPASTPASELPIDAQGARREVTERDASGASERQDAAPVPAESKA